MRIDRIKASFSGIPIVTKGDYRYFVHPLSDGIPAVDPDLLRTVAEGMAELLPPKSEYDILLTAEAMGIPLVSAISTIVGKPFSIARKRRYGLEGEISLEQVTGYSQNDLYLNLPMEAMRIVIIDDVLSTGGTVLAMVEGARSLGRDIVSVAVFVDKMDMDARARFEERIRCGVRTLVHVDVIGDECVLGPGR